jgi:hypothetical protein
MQGWPESFTCLPGTDSPLAPGPYHGLNVPLSVLQRAVNDFTTSAMQYLTRHERTTACCTYGKSVVHDGTIGVDVIGEGDYNHQQAFRGGRRQVVRACLG